MTLYISDWGVQKTISPHLDTTVTPDRQQVLSMRVKAHRRDALLGLVELGERRLLVLIDLRRTLLAHAHRKLVTERGNGRPAAATLVAHSGTAPTAMVLSFADHPLLPHRLC